MPELTYRITTLGCRVNHAETREMASLLHRHGLQPANGDRRADLEVIHTCTVTQTAVRKSRHAIRRRSRGADQPRLGVIVTGCFTGTDPKDAASLSGGPGNVVPHHDSRGGSLMERFAERVDTLLSRGNGRAHEQSPIRREDPSGSDRSTCVHPLPVVRPHGVPARHLRAELKIQDGCDAACTFCILPRIRPTLRSKSIADALAEARQLVDLGHREIVLTGIFIGAFGHETALRRRQAHPKAEHLAELIDTIAQIPGLARLRLSSMEPGDVSESLLDAMVANSGTVVPHLHLPLQSGADRILRRMNRQYRVGDYLEMVAMVNEALTREGLPPAITTDIICGFPGETKEDFLRTVEVADRVRFLHIHVFPFSPRSGTAAARWSGQFVPSTVRKARVRLLIDREVDPRGGYSIEYRKRLVGRTVRVIVEQPGRRPNTVVGRCDHYVQITVDSRAERGSVLSARVVAADGDETRARVEPLTRLPILRDGRALS